MLRGALIGLGNVALHGHLPGWRRRRDVEIVGGTDSRPEQRAEDAPHAGSPVTTVLPSGKDRTMKCPV